MRFWLLGKKKVNGHPRYLEISSYDLDLCLKLGDVYIGKNQQVFNRPSQSTCLYSLFIAAHEAAKDQCELELEHKRYDQVVSIGSDEFCTMPPHPAVLSLNVLSCLVLSCLEQAEVNTSRKSGFLQISCLVQKLNSLHLLESMLVCLWESKIILFSLKQFNHSRVLHQFLDLLN